MEDLGEDAESPAEMEEDTVTQTEVYMGMADEGAADQQDPE